MNYLFLFLLCWSLSATSESFVSQPASDPLLLGRNRDAASESRPPDPADLSADWWRYFDVRLSDLPEHIDKTVGQLQILLQKIPENEKKDAKAYLARLIENLHTLLELRKKQSPQAQPARSLQNAYTLKQWLEIARKRRSVQAELQTENEVLLRDSKRSNALHRQIDSMTAAYLAVPSESPDKIMQGLALMASWSELALNDERLRLQNLALSIQKTLLERLIEESKAAQDRLTVEDEDIRRLKGEIETAEHERLSAQEKTFKLASSSVTETLETDEGKARALLSEQQIRLSAINESIADIIVTRKKIALDLARVLISSKTIGLDDFRKRFNVHVDRIAEISAKLASWRDIAERDQWLAGKSLAALLSATDQQNSELIALSQQRLAEAQNTLLALQRLEAEIDDANLITANLRSLIAKQDGTLKNGLASVKNTYEKAEDLLWDKLSASLFKIGETPVTSLGILRVVLILILAWILSNFVRRGLTHLSVRQRGSSVFLYTLGRLAHYLILIIGISIGLSSIGVDLSNFALIAGALSLGMGFGLQAIVSNFVSGLIVLFERSLRLGDFVELSSGLAGEVRAINVRSTLVTTPDLVDVLVPNSEFVNGKVINWTLTDSSRRIHIPFGVAYGSDKEVVRRAGLEAAENTPHTLKNRIDREPEVWLTNFGDSSLDFELIVWVLPHAVKKPQRVRAAYYWELETALKKYGITIPFPQRDLHIRSGLASLDATDQNENPPASTE